MRIVFDGPPGDPLLEHERDPVRGRLLDEAGAWSREWMKNPFVPNRRLWRCDSVGLRNPFADVLVRRAVEVRRPR